MNQDQGQKSPLEEADPRSLADLFSSDPFTFTKQDRARIVAELRRARANWLEDEKKGATRAKKPVLSLEALKSLKIG